MTKPRSQRWIPWLLVVLFGVPPLVAWTLYVSGWHPGSTTNHGQFIRPPQSISGEGLASTEGKPADKQLFIGRWTLLVAADGECGETCRRELMDTRQIRLAMGKEMDRVQRVLFLPPGAPALPEAISRLHPGLKVFRADVARIRSLAGDNGEPGDVIIQIVDPAGLRMMRYGQPLDAHGMMKDLQKLLKVSNRQLETIKRLDDPEDAR